MLCDKRCRASDSRRGAGKRANAHHMWRHQGLSSGTSPILSHRLPHWPYQTSIWFPSDPRSYSLASGKQVFPSASCVLPSEIRLFCYTANITFSLSKFPSQSPGTFSRSSSDPSWSMWGLCTFLHSCSRLWAATDGISLVPTLPCCLHSGWLLKEKESETLSSGYHSTDPFPVGQRHL